MSNVQAGQLGVTAAIPSTPAQQTGPLEALKNCVECLQKLAQGDKAGALKELMEACNAATGAGQGTQKPPPGLGLDPFEMLRQLLSQGQGQGQAAGGAGSAGGAGGAGNAGGAGGAEGAGGAGGAQGGDQAGMAQMIQMLMAMLLQNIMKQGSGGGSGQAA